jgi:hypothetical protein
MTTIDLKAAFFHVIDPHRWLATSGCVWNLVGAGAVSAENEKTHRILPNIDVLARDTILLHARTLIKFYRNVSNRPTDIILSDFSVPSIGQSLDIGLKEHENSIEVHLLHLTDWRDCDYRKQYATGKHDTKDRRDWNRDTTLIVDLIFNALKDASNHKSDWQQPFADLHGASTSRYRDKSYDWPKNLGEKADVEQYLKACGLR